MLEVPKQEPTIALLAMQNKVMKKTFLFLVFKWGLKQKEAFH
jgi:hypothetical protein